MGFIYIYENPNLVDISGLNAIEEIDENGISMGIDTHPYTTQIDDNSTLCTTDIFVFVQDAEYNRIDAWKSKMCTDTTAPEISLNGDAIYIVNPEKPTFQTGKLSYTSNLTTI